MIMETVEEIKKEPKTNAIVTFLIGNGFDIGLGLRTTYRDFLNWYLEQQSNTEVINNLKQNIRQDKELWGDAELAFGKLRFSSFGADSYSVVSECLLNFNTALTEYLKTEEKRFAKPDKELQNSFCSCLCSYYQVLGDYPTRNELRRLKRFKQLKVNIVNFNYTETVDKLLPSSGPMTLPGWGEVDVRINEVCHVHGALSVGHSRLFGVNMMSQVEDAKLSNESKMLLIKPEIDRMAGCGLEPMAKEMIDESDTVILFGLSLGETDRLWWDYLFDYLRNRKDHRLCLMQYVQCDQGTLLVGQEGLWANEERHKFFNSVDPQKVKYANISDIERLIYVSTRGPHLAPDGQETFCDPFHLAWFGKKLVKGNSQKIRKTNQSGDSPKISIKNEGTYYSPAKKGTFTFNYSNNDGEYVIGEGDAMFRTRWSKSSNTSIHAYKDGKGITAIARLKEVGDIESINTIEGDFSSRVRTPQIGDAIVWKNDKGKYAITKVVSIKDDTRGDDHDELTCNYIIVE